MCGKPRVVRECAHEGVVNTPESYSPYDEERVRPEEAPNGIQASVDRNGAGFLVIEEASGEIVLGRGEQGAERRGEPFQ